RLVFQDKGPPPSTPALRIRPDGQPEKLVYNFYGLDGERSGVMLRNVGSEYELNLPGGGKEHYDANAVLTWLENAVGQRTTLTHSASGVSTVTGPFGHTLQFAYDAHGQMLSMTDPDGRVYQYGYANGMLTSVTYPDGTQRIYHYEGSSSFTL